jgi:hypothetical protein
LAFGVYPAS